MPVSEAMITYSVKTLENGDALSTESVMGAGLSVGVCVEDEKRDEQHSKGISDAP